MKRMFSLGLSLFIVLALIVSGCQSPTNSSKPIESGNTKEVPAKGDKTLKLMIPNYFNDIDKELWVKIVNKFEELNTDINIDLTTGDMQVENGKLTTMLQSGITPPDAMLINAGAGRVKILADSNLIKPMNELYTQNSWEKKIKPFAYGLVSGTENIYELPHSMDAMQVYYHKDVFEKYGISIPTNKDELIQVMQKLKEAGITPISVGGRDRFPISWMFSQVLESVSGRQAMEDILYGDGKWNDPAALKAIETLGDWVKNGYVSKDSISLTAADAKFSFLNKKTAMGFYSTQIIVDAVENKIEGNLGSFTLPSFIEGQKAAPASGLGTTWVLPANGKNSELSITWLNFVLSEDFSKIVLTEPSYNFILVSNSAALTEPAGQLLKQAMEAVDQDSGYNPAVFVGPETKEAYFQNLQGIVGGLTSPKAAADSIQAGKDKDVKAGYRIEKK